MYFLIKVDDWLEKYNSIWDKASADIKKEFDSNPLYNNFLKNKKKNLTVMELQIFIVKGVANLTWLAVFSLDFGLNKDGNYYPQVF